MYRHYLRRIVGSAFGARGRRGDNTSHSVRMAHEASLETVALADRSALVRVRAQVESQAQSIAGYFQ